MVTNTTGLTEYIINEMDKKNLTIKKTFELAVQNQKKGNYEVV